MPDISSPVFYPPSSSPPAPKARADLGKPRQTIGGFQADDSDDDDCEWQKLMPAAKKQKTSESSVPPVGANQTSIFANRAVNQSESMGGFSWGMTTSTKSTPTTLENTTTFAGFIHDDEEEEVQQEQDKNVSDASLQDSFTSSVTLPTSVNTSASTSFSNGSTPVHREVRNCAGKKINIFKKRRSAPVSLKDIVAERSVTKAGRAKKSYYGIDIHQLVETATSEQTISAAQRAEPEVPLPSVEVPESRSKDGRTPMWSEKYRARRFMDLVGDDRTHRQVLRWLKAWDPIVFPGLKSKVAAVDKSSSNPFDEQKTQRKILLLTGPPGLGKTTLAHVCAKQAGYDVMEINASDERSRDVVKGRIRTAVGTESVKSVSSSVKDGQIQNAARPVCVVVDEVDGVVGGSGGSGDGGFIKALLDLVILDQKNSSGKSSGGTSNLSKKQRDDFRISRPLILICNDVYHPSLRPLRQSSFAEIVHVRPPPLAAVSTRISSIFEREGIRCDGDAVRKLCEATWSVETSPQKRNNPGSNSDGDIRSIMIVAEWVAGRFRRTKHQRLTRKWLEQSIIGDLSYGGSGARGMGRGNVKDIVSRVFLSGAGFPKPPSAVEPATFRAKNVPVQALHAKDIEKKAAMERLSAMVEASGDVDRIVTEIWSNYPSQPFNDDNVLSKPDAAYEWLHFHDQCSGRVFSEQEWELMPYLSQPVLAYHDLFASSSRHTQSTGRRNQDAEEEETEPVPFSGPRADHEAHEAEKANRATVLELQASLSAPLLRAFRSPEDISTDLLPFLFRMLTPDIKPIVVGGSGSEKGIASVRKQAEKDMVRHAVDVMNGVGVIFERGRLENDGSNPQQNQWVYRMNPPLDSLVIFETALAAASTAAAPVRYAVRQVLDQEYQRSIKARENAARQARLRPGAEDANEVAKKKSDVKEFMAVDADGISTVKKDFFGRILKEERASTSIDGSSAGGKAAKVEAKVWISYHEGFSNAVRKPLTLGELLRGL